MPVETVIRDRYRLERRLGQGSVSIVYGAHDLTAGTTNAVKIMLPELVGNDRALSDRFLREATAAAAVHHPNIVAVTDSGVVNDVVPFIVMEFVSGTSLQDTLSASGALAPAEAFAYVSAIGSGLAAAHQHGIIHGDLKPRNILIEPDRPLAEAIKILDFGLSGIKSGKVHGPLAVARASSMLRAASYLAPEEWSDDEEPDQRSDIYSLGIILYQMLAGDLPFKGRSNPAIMKQHLMTAPPPIVGPSGPIASALETVVLHALQKEPDKRPATVDEFVAELSAAIDATPPSSGKGAKRATRKKAPASIPRAPARGRKREPVRPVVEDVKSESEEQEFDGFSTIVLQARPEPTVDVPQPNFDQTIVLPRPPRAEAGAEKPLAYRDQSGSSEPPAAVPAGSHEQEMNVDDEQGWEGIGIEEEMGDDVQAASADGTEQLPKSIPPVLLAAGVILIILLIGLGVYYSHVSQ